MAKQPVKFSGDVTRDVEAIFNDGALVDLSIGYWTAKRRNEARDLKIKEEDIPDYVVGLGTKRLVPKELSDQWQYIAQHARYVLRHHSFSFPIGDTPFVPIKALPVIEEKLRKLQAQFEQQKNYLRKHYDQIKRDTVKKHPRLAPLYPPRDVALASFYFTWSVFSVAVPKKAQLAAFSAKKAGEAEKVMARYRTELERRMQTFLGDVITTLRAKAVELCEDIAAKIKSGDVVTDRSLKTLDGFIEKFKMMNFVGDADVESRLTKLQQDLLKGRDAEAFKDDEALRRQLGRALDDVRRAASQVSDVSNITGGYRRRIVI